MHDRIRGRRGLGGLVCLRHPGISSGRMERSWKDCEIGFSVKWLLRNARSNDGGSGGERFAAQSLTDTMGGCGAIGQYPRMQYMTLGDETSEHLRSTLHVNVINLHFPMCNVGLRER